LFQATDVAASTGLTFRSGLEAGRFVSPSAAGAPEARILEIAELAYILEADGFAEPEIFRRVGVVFPPSPDLNRFSLTGDLLRAHAVGHLSVHAPSYIKLGPQLLKSALALAELWAMRRADQLRDLKWPREDMLATTSSWAYPGNHGPDDWAEDLDVDTTDVVTVLHALMGRTPFPRNPELRRMRARAVPGDRLWDYSTGADSFRFNMGSAGIALVRNGRTIRLHGSYDELTDGLRELPVVLGCSDEIGIRGRMSPG
jgi:hypothetical protein